MSDVDIPDEAPHLVLIVETTYEEGPWLECRCGWTFRLGFDATPAMAVKFAVEHDPAAAPHIARQAQVQILRELHAELAETYTAHLNTGIAPGLGDALREISDKFEALEAGGDQTGASDDD